jgi:Replication-relaxation
MAVAKSDDLLFLTPVYARLLYGSSAMPIGLYHLYKASAAQLTRLHHAGKSEKLTKKRLRTLADHDYVSFDERPTAEYRSPYYYVLSNRAIEQARSLGMTVSSSYQPSKEIGQNYLHLLHHLGVNDVLISAAILKRQAPEYNLEHFLLTRDLAHEPFNASWCDKPYGTVPDLFLDFREALQDGRQRRTPILIEHDKGTESEEVIRQKIHAYSAMITSGWHKTRYGVNSITIAFTTFEGERRRDKLREWARQELHDQDRTLVSSFLFTTQQQPPDPTHLWLNPCWYTPYMEDKPVAILAQKG